MASNYLVVINNKLIVCGIVKDDGNILINSDEIDYHLCYIQPIEGDILLTNNYLEQSLTRNKIDIYFFNQNKN